MEYFFIFIFQILGVLTHVAQKVIAFDKQYPDKTIGEIRELFFENEWSSLIASGVFLLLHIALHGAIDYYGVISIQVINVPVINLLLPIGFVHVLIAIIIGYGGQRIVYKYLGNVEQYLADKADKINNQ